MVTLDKWSLVLNLWPGSALLPSEEPSQKLCEECVEGGTVSKTGCREENTENWSLTEVDLALIHEDQGGFFFFLTLLVNLWRVLAL